jgi:ethanolamine ammonia-lyase large subunit
VSTASACGLVTASLAAFDPSPTPFIVLMAIGFLIGGVGHLYESKALIATGIGLIFMATLGLPLGIYLSDN